MARLEQLFELRTYVITYVITSVAIISFSAFVAHLFGVIIPNVVGSFFKGFGEVLVLAAVLGFILAWFLKAKPHNRPKRYTIVPFDVFGRESKIEGIRTEFGTHDVAWSFMRQYKARYPLYNFAMVARIPKSKRPTIFRYI